MIIEYSVLGPENAIKICSDFEAIFGKTMGYSTGIFSIFTILM